MCTLRGAVASRAYSVSLRVRVRVGRADGAAVGAGGHFT